MANVTFNRSVGTVNYSNMANMFNKGSGYGAAIGSKFNMGWGTLIGAGIGGVVGIVSSLIGNKEADKIASQYFKAADLANNATLQELARNVGQVYRQRTILAMQTQSALQYTQNQALKAGAQSEAIFYAADQIGNQLDYIKSNIQDQKNQQNYMALFNYETQIQNSNQQIKNLTNTAKNMFTGVNVTGGEFSATQALNDVHNSAMMMFGGSDLGGMFGGKTAGALGNSAMNSSAGNSFSSMSSGMGISGSLGLA